MILGYYCCGACETKIREDKWNKHCDTKQHKKHAEKSIYAKEVFDSNFICKTPLVFTFMPKIEWRNK